MIVLDINIKDILWLIKEKIKKVFKRNTVIALIILIGLIPACEMVNVSYPVIGEIEDYDFEGSEEIPEFETIEEAARWISNNFIYTYDDKDYWQTPEETFYRRNEYNKMMGDCEDKAILFQFIIDTQFNIPSSIAAVQFPNSKGLHAMVYVNELYYEIPEEKGFLISLPKLRSDIKIHYYIPYSEALWMTINYHNNVGKYR